MNFCYGIDADFDIEDYVIHVINRLLFYSVNCKICYDILLHYCKLPVILVSHMEVALSKTAAFLN